MPDRPSPPPLPTSARPAPSYAVVLPVKPPAVGKTRLVGLPDGVRAQLARAFAVDTLDAVVACRAVTHVVVVTDDAEVATAARGRGADVVGDPGRGLNEALLAGADRVSARWPGAVPVALLADLPALEAADLDTALRAIDVGRGGFVADADGVGTTLYTGAGTPFRPAFGPSSRAAHAAGGAVEVTDSVPSLRRDVDDLAGLHAAVALGVGPATRDVVTAHLDLPVSDSSAP